MSIKFKYTKRPGDWHVCLEGQPDFWECGKSVNGCILQLLERLGHLKYKADQIVEFDLNPKEARNV